nr:hypothetical protein [Tanacetum cinerariifolium]
MMPQSPPWSKPLHQIINALIAKELMRYPDMNVNISAACSIGEILRITAPIAPYNNEQILKLSSESGRYYGKMIKVLEVFCKARLPVLMLDLKLDGHGLIVRLFKDFLNASNFDSTAIVPNVEKIITMIIEKSEKLAIELQTLIRTSTKKDNQGGKETITDTAKASKVMKDTTHKIKLECPEGINMVQTLRPCQAASMPSKSIMELNGKRKRNGEQIQAQSAEHGEILGGRRIKVWQAKDEMCEVDKHLLRDGRGSAYKVSSPESGIICVHGYKIKTINASILEAIFKKHGDVGAKCVFPDAMRTYLLEAVCEIVKRMLEKFMITEI